MLMFVLDMMNDSVTLRLNSSVCGETLSVLLVLG